MFVRSTPSCFSPDEFLPIHKSTLVILRNRVEAVKEVILLIACHLEHEKAPAGAPEVLEMVIERLSALQEDLSPDNITPPKIQTF